MDTSKIFLLLCAFVLIVCLTMSITTLVVLRNAIDENGSLQTEAGVLVDRLDNCLKELEEVMVENEDSIAASGEGISTEEATGFCLRESNGIIGIYTTEGYLIHLLDVSVSTLPSSARQALKSGLVVGSWEELRNLVRDFTS